MTPRARTQNCLKDDRIYIHTMMMHKQFIAAPLLAWMIVSPLTATIGLFARKGQPAAAKAPTSKITSQRRNQLGIADDEDEYDLDKALENNTDPFISKLVAGSLIVVLLGLLIVGVVIPSLTDYGEGVCSPIQNGGRC
jgi:hypothetical protein